MKMGSFNKTKSKTNNHIITDDDLKYEVLLEQNQQLEINNIRLRQEMANIIEENEAKD